MALLVVFLMALSAIEVIEYAPGTVRAQTSPPFTGVGPWNEQFDYGASSGASGSGGIPILGVSCVTYQSYVYCIGGQNLKDLSNPDQSAVFYSQVSSSGTLGPWTETIDYGAASGTQGTGGQDIEWPSCVQSGGYVYCVAGATNNGIISKVYYAQLTTSGVGPWTETTDYGAASGATGSGGTDVFQLSCVVNAGYIFCVGGGAKTFYAPISSTGVGAWTETTDYGATSGTAGSGGIAINSQACTEDSGYIYCIGGTIGQNITSRVFYAPLSSGGIGPWTETVDYGATSGTTGSGGVPIFGATCTTYSGYIVCFDGDTTGFQGTNHVYYGQDPSPAGIVSWVLDAINDPETTYWLNCVFFALFIGATLEEAAWFCSGGGSSAVYEGPLTTVEGTSSTTTILTSSSISPTASSTTTSTTSLTPTTTTSTTTPIVSPTSTTPTIVGPSTTTTGIGVGGGTPWTWIGVGIGLLIIIGILAWLFLRRKPPVTPPPGVTDDGTEPGTEEGEACKLEKQWFLQDFTLSAAIGEKWNPTGSATVPEQHMLVTKPAGEPMPMSAQALDRHIFLYGCTCEDTVDQKLIHVDAVVRYEWEISSGGGSFVRITGGPGKSTEVGNQVIYLPPELAEGQSTEVRILSKAKHYDDTKFPDHPQLVISVNVNVKRVGGNYVWEWWPTETTSVKGPAFNAIKHPEAPCAAKGDWNNIKPIEGLIEATLFIPGVSGPPEERQSGECAPGDYVRFEFKGQDYDQFTITCNPPTALAIGTPLPGQVAKAKQNPAPGGKCLPSKDFVTMLDPLIVTWVSTDGYFVGTENTVNQLVAVWRAPQHEGVVEINVSIDDSGLEFDDAELNLGTKITIRKRK